MTAHTACHQLIQPDKQQLDESRPNVTHHPLKATFASQPINFRQSVCMGVVGMQPQTDLSQTVTINGIVPNQLSHSL
jgi:hypothetical protein